MTKEQPALGQLDDRELLLRFCQCRNEQAFVALIARHGPMVQRVCQRKLNNQQDVEDVFQAVFMVLARKASRVRWQSSIANWLYGVAWRVACCELRRRARALGRIVRPQCNLNLILEIERTHHSAKH